MPILPVLSDIQQNRPAHHQTSSSAPHERPASPSASPEELHPVIERGYTCPSGERPGRDTASGKSDLLVECTMSDRGATLAAPGILPALGIALAVCFVALSRARASAPSAVAESRRRRRRRANDLKRKRPVGTQTEVCEGLVDLIRDLDAPPEEQVVGPCMAREELARGLLVVVVIGPASTKIHQVGQISTRPCLVV